MSETEEIPVDENKDGSEILTKEELWERVGFHKAMGGWWYGLIFLMVNMFTGIFVTSTVIAVFYPFPSSGAYVSTVGSLFGLMVFAFDIGTAGIMGRFIPESRISDPARMIQYIRWFVWYQMITGLIQMTAVAIFCMFFATKGDLAYLSWIMLLISTTQYPGMLGVFQNLLNTFQYFGKSQIVSFTQGEIVQRLTELAFVWAGMVIGQNNPQIGMLLGIALGQSVGKYADDFVGMALAAHYFKGVARKEGFRMIDCFIPKVQWKVVKPVLIFAIKTSIPGFTANMVNLYVLNLYLANVPQWIIFGAFLGMAGGITSDMNYANLNVGPQYNESFMNGKKILAQTILKKTYRFAGQILGFFFAVFVVVYMVLPDAFEAFKLYHYYPCLVYIIPCLIRNAINIALGQSGSILYATNKPNLLLLYGYLGQISGAVYHTLLVVVFKVQDMENGIFFLVMWAGNLLGWFFSITQHIYINQKIFKIKIAFWQTFAVPALCSVSCMGIALLAYNYILLPLKEQVGFLIALIPFMIIMIMVAIYVYFPLTALFGGWDDASLEEFRKVVKISGPSKFIVANMYKMLLALCKRSPLHNKFPLDDEAALRESRELDVIKEQSRDKLHEAL
ncbi:MAG: hypothetical protein ACFFCS_09610 [Candidatus Hodarchaeota archaeon]